MDRARCLLDELLGPDRDRLAKARWDEHEYRDVCVFMLAGFCPHRMLAEVKAHAGRCPFSKHGRHFVRLYERCRRPGLFEKERALLQRLTEIYVESRVKMLRARSRATPVDSLDDRTVLQVSVLKAEREEAISNMYGSICSGYCENAEMSHRSAKSLKDEIGSRMQARMEICEDCGKEFAPEHQPPGYWGAACQKPISSLLHNDSRKAIRASPEARRRCGLCPKTARKGDLREVCARREEIAVGCTLSGRECHGSCLPFPWSRCTQVALRRLLGTGYVFCNGTKSNMAFAQKRSAHIYKIEGDCGPCHV